MTTAAEIAGRVRDAAERGAPLRIRGRGHWMSANRPVQAAAELSLADCTGITEYVPGDLTLTARAGTPLAEIADATREHGQWLALDPFGGDDGSIGATVATASSGPLATGFGTPRDQLLGVEFVTGGGDVVRGGGRVVKNVAGFDLVRLNTGAWGTLGVLTEVTVRLRALPAARETLALPVADDERALQELCTALRGLAPAPFACELLSADLAAMAGLPPRATLLVRIGGNTQSVRAQRAALATLGGGTAPVVDDVVWHRVRTASTAGDATWRLSRGPSRVAATWTAGRDALAPFAGAWMHGSPLRGTVRCTVPAASWAAGPLDHLLHAVTHPFDGARIAETLPTHAWSVLPSPVMDRLSRGVRAAFDPHRVLNPGIMGAIA